MLVRIARALSKEEAGQSLVLAAVWLLILALAVTATLQIGAGIHARIQLQSASDASAYSQAALVARTLNYFAYANRTQIVHYVAAMALQAIPAMWSAVVATLGMARDLIATLASVTCQCCNVPVYGSACCPTYDILDATFSALDPVAEQARSIESQIDELSIIVPYFQYLNQDLLFWSAKAMKDLTIAALGDGNAAGGSSSAWVPVDARAAAGTSVGSVADTWIPLLDEANAKSYAAMFDTNAESFEGNNTYQMDDDHARAQRIMAEIANATRTGNSGPPNAPLTNRRLTPPGFAPVLSWFGLQHHGQTRLMNPYAWVDFSDPASNPIWRTVYPYSQMSSGVSLNSADDVQLSPLGGLPNSVTVPTGGMSRMVTGIQSTPSNLKGMGTNLNPSRYHCRYDGYTRIPGGGCLDGHLSQYRCSDEGDLHNWPGLANFIKFNPTSDPDQDFNQNSFWATRKLDPTCASFHFMSGGRCVDTLPFGFGGFGRNAMGPIYGSGGFTSGRVGDVAPSWLGTGLHAISVAQVYYHRPETWSEHPNFFNPFWRARLAPIQDKLKRLPGSSTLAEVVRQSLPIPAGGSKGVAPQTILMH
jgi:hypothetical protein